MRLVALLCLGLAACGEPPVAPQQDPAPASKDGAQPPAGEHPNQPAPDVAPVRLAKVVEVLNGAPRYTFARMDACGAEAWVAGPKVEMTVGQTAEMQGGQGMVDFKSEALNRTFPELLMVDGWRATEAEPSCGPPPAPLRFGKIVQLHTTEAYTITELAFCGTNTWVAAPNRKGLEVGGLVGTPMGYESKNFYSSSLERSFEQLFMVEWIKKAKSLPACPPQ